MSNETNGYQAPFPALTRSQRWHLDVLGYVVVEGVFSESETTRMRDALQELKAEFLAKDDPWGTTIRGATIYGRVPHDDRVHFDSLVEAHPAFLEYAIHPRIIGMIEEVVGNQVRLTELQATINSRNFNVPYPGAGRYQWHRNRPATMTFDDNGLFHCEFVKAITNLTDLGPDDGGTSVIAGSHKSSAPEEGIVRAAREDPSLIHHVVAPAGSTLIFCETLLHSSGDILSDRERAIIISGYHPSNRIRSSGAEYTEALAERMPEAARTIIYGSNLSPRMRRRELDWDVGSADPGNYADGWSLTSAEPDSYEVVSLTKTRPATSA